MARRKKIIVSGDRSIPPPTKQDPHVVIYYRDGGKKDTSHHVYPSKEDAETAIKRIGKMKTKLLTQDQYFKMFNEGKFYAGRSK